MSKQNARGRPKEEVEHVSVSVCKAFISLWLGKILIAINNQVNFLSFSLTYPVLTDTFDIDINIQENALSM